MQRWLICLALAAAACSTRRVVVMGGEVHAHLGELRRARQARVDALAETDRGFARTPETVRIDQWVHVDGRRRRLDDLAFQCPDEAGDRSAPIPDENRCELLVRRNDELLLRTYKEPASLRQVAGGVLVGALALGFVGGIACSFACDSPYQEISIATLSGLFVAAIVGCIRSSSCHD